MDRAPYLFPSGAALGADNVVLHARAARHKVDNYAGPLSIKTVLSGDVAWKVCGRDLVVNRNSFLIISDGETYSMEIDAPKPVETCCVFFARGFVERIVLDATSPLELALEAPDRAVPALPYLSALHGDRERSLVARVQSLAARCKAALAPSGFEEHFFVLASELLRFYEEIQEQADRVPATRESTRSELYRRLLIGREYMHSHVSGPLSLDAAARAACVSRFHFHRGFTQAFRQTPHAYITGLRLDRARQLIEHGSSVLDAALDVGFSSASTFTGLFKSRFGKAPSKFARSKK